MEEFFPVTSAMMLSMECSLVIALRLSKLAAGGPDAYFESLEMVTEKVTSALNAAGSLATGATPADVVAQYRKTVAANTKRLA